MIINYIIYLLRVNKHIYIGCTTNAHKREIHHKCLLNKNKHFNKVLQYSYNKNRNINFFMLKECGSLDLMFKAEKDFISTFRSNGLTLANMTNGGEGTIGKKHTEEAKNKMSLKKKGQEQHKNSLSALLLANSGNKYSAKKIKCVETGEIFESLVAAAKNLGIKYSTLSMAVRHKSLTRKNLSFEYIEVANEY